MSTQLNDVISTETCGMGSVFPPDELWIDFDTYTNLH